MLKEVKIVFQHWFSLIFKGFKCIVFTINRRAAIRAKFTKPLQKAFKMRFSEIKSFTSKGHYEIDVPLKDTKETIEYYVEHYGLQLNPDFQRGHVWTETQQCRYVEYLLKNGTGSRVMFFNSPNWSSHRPICSKPFVCVDGLQRITAIIRFLSNEFKVFGYYYNEFEDDIDLMNCIRFNINNLQTRREALQWYLDLNSGGTVHCDAELERVRSLLAGESD